MGQFLRLLDIAVYQAINPTYRTLCGQIYFAGGCFCKYLKGPPPTRGENARPRRQMDASGQLAFNNACRTCHSVKEGDNRLGPNLYKVFGRKAGSLPNYNYSIAMRSADFVWDKTKMENFIADPEAVVPGNKMKPYGGLGSAAARKEVIAFLASLNTGR